MIGSVHSDTSYEFRCQNEIDNLTEKNLTEKYVVQIVTQNSNKLRTAYIAYFKLCVFDNSVDLQFDSELKRTARKFRYTRQLSNIAKFV